MFLLAHRKPYVSPTHCYKEFLYPKKNLFKKKKDNRPVMVNTIQLQNDFELIFRICGLIYVHYIERFNSLISYYNVDNYIFTSRLRFIYFSVYSNPHFQTKCNRAAARDFNFAEVLPIFLKWVVHEGHPD